MKKLRLDSLTVESFATAAPSAGARGTVLAHRTASWCPESWDGTCWVTCWETCQETCEQTCWVSCVQTCKNCW
jgi:hypothetical protein